MDDVDSTARQLRIARDGAMVNGYLDDPSSVADSLSAAFVSFLTAAAPGLRDTGRP